jgi:hypothetical protein
MAGRPRSDIDWDKVDKFLQAQCDGVSIAGILGIAPLTLYRACQREYNVNFDTYSATKKAEGKELLRANQFKLAMDGNTAMNIWLGKQLLNQRDQIEQRITVPQVHVQPLNDAEQLEISTAIGMLQQDNESNGDIHTEPEGGSIE